MATTIADLIVKLSAQGIQGVERDLQKLGRSTKRTAADIEEAGSAFTVLGAAGTAAFGLVARESIGFQSAFAGVRKTVDASEEAFGELSDQIRDLALEIPESAQQLAGIAETAGQLGIEAGSIDEFTKTVAQLGTASNITGQEGATMLARFANVTGITNPEDYERLGSAIVDLGNNSATTEQEILEMGQRLAGAGSTAGIAAPEILGIAAALSSVGINAEAGGTAFSKLIIQMSEAVETGNEDLEKFAEVAGISGQEFASAFRENGAQALNLFIQGLARTEEQGGNLFSVLEDLGLTEVRLRDSILRSTQASDLFNESVQRGRAAFEANNALQKEAAERYKTVEAQLQILLNQFRDIAISVGDAVLPAINSMLQTIRPLVDSVIEFTRNNSELVGTLTLVAGGLSALSFGGGIALLAVGQVTSAVGALLPLLPKLAGAFTIAKTAGLAIPALLSGPVGIAAAAIAAGAGIGTLLSKLTDTKDEAPVVGKSVEELRQEIARLGGEVDKQAQGETWEKYTERLQATTRELRNIKQASQEAREGFRDVSVIAGVTEAATAELKAQQAELTSELLSGKIGADQYREGLDKLNEGYDAAIGKTGGGGIGGLIDAIQSFEPEQQKANEAVEKGGETLDEYTASVERFVPAFEGLTSTVRSGAVSWDRLAAANREAARELAVIADGAPEVTAGLDQMAESSAQVAADLATVGEAALEIEVLRGRADAAVGPLGDLGDAADEVAVAFPDIVDTIEEVGPALERNAGVWAGWQRQVSTILSDFGSDVADVFFGAGRREHNERLAQEEASLRQSLDERLADWQQYAADVDTQLADLSTSHQENLQDLEVDLAQTLADLDSEWAEYRQDAAAELQQLNEDHAETIADIDSDLAGKLADLDRGWERYTEDVAIKFADIEEEHTDSLADIQRDLTDTLADLDRELNDALARSQERFERNRDRITSRRDEGIGRAEQRLADKRLDLADAEEDAAIRLRRIKEDELRRIQELQERGADPDDIQDVKRRAQRQREDINRSLERRRRDFEIFQKRIKAEIEKREREAREALAREEQQLRDSINQRTAEYERETAEARANADRRTAAANEKYEEETAALQLQVDRRTADYERERREAIDNANARRDAAIESHQEETAELEANIIEREKKYQRERKTAIDEAKARREGLIKEYTQEQQDLIDSLDDRKGELDDFVNNANAKLDELAEEERTLGSDLLSVFATDLPNAVTRFVSEFIVGKLFAALGDLLTDILPSIKDAFGAIFGLGGGASQATGAAGSAAGSVAQGIGNLVASGIINTITGAVSAVADVFGLFQNARQETTLNAIEESTRRGTLFLGDRGDGGILGRLFSIEEDAGYITANTDTIKSTLWAMETEQKVHTLRWDTANGHLARLETIDQNIAAMAQGAGFGGGPSVQVTVNNPTLLSEQMVDALGEGLVSRIRRGVRGFDF